MNYGYAITENNKELKQMAIWLKQVMMNLCYGYAITASINFTKESLMTRF